MKAILKFLGRIILWPFSFRRLGKLWIWEKAALVLVLILFFSPIPAVFRDVSFVVYAHQQEQLALRIAQDAHCRAGDEEACIALERHDIRLPFKADYARSQALEEKYEWGVITNSRWLADQSRLILPYFAYEGVSTWEVGIYPRLVAFFPFGGDRSFHVLGTVPEGQVVILNERLVLDPRLNDEVEAKAVLIHELVHTQGGKYLEWPPETWEAYTSAATLEVEAGMCNYGDPVACAAFWKDFEGMVRGSLKYAALSVGVPWLYDAFANVWLRSDEETIWAAKQARFFDDHGEDLKTLLYKYDALPWATLVLPQFRGIAMKTGHTQYDMTGIGWYHTMFFDDMLAMLGQFHWLGRLVGGSYLR